MRIHDLRFTTANNIYRVTKKIHSVMNAFGHTDAKVTMNYLGLSHDYLGVLDEDMAVAEATQHARMMAA